MTTEHENSRVRVSFETSASIEEAFYALVRSDQLALWFGTPTAPLRAGGATRFEFGDGDFFTVDHIAIERTRRVSYRWRFLGLGPSNRITWRLEPRGLKTEVTVSDEQVERDDLDVEAMRAGWRDFTDRLARYLATGERTRYDWRRDIDGGVELACNVDRAAARLFATDALDRWQPWRGEPWRPGGQLRVVDGGDPDTLQLVQFGRTSNELRFAITAPGWRQPTRCELALAPRRNGSMLTVSHTGWDHIENRDASQRSQRQRFCGLWIYSLKRARVLLGES